MLNRIARFTHVSREQFEQDWQETFSSPTPAFPPLPVRATAGSAGYDFASPLSFTLKPGETVKIPTGIRAEMEPGWVLLVFPRSSLGFKYRLQLNNTVGVIDADYAFAKNEGHIFLKLTNDSNDNKTLEVPAGMAIAQGIFLPFGITEDDCADAVRTGGIGSTTKNGK